MKKYGWLILAIVLLAGGCQRQPIDKQEADAIVTKYVKNNFKTDDNAERVVWYYNRLAEERIEMSFWDGAENIIAENAFVYYIDEDFNMGEFPHPHRIILVPKKDGRYTVFHRSVSPYVKTWDDWNSNWTYLYLFVNGQFLD